VASGHAHIANEHGEEPRAPQRWGWRPEEYHTGEGTGTRHKRQGLRVGWLADGELYLEPNASFAAVQRFARDQNESFAISATTLGRRRKERGLLAATDTARGRLTVRRTLQGARRDVLHIARTGAPSAPATGEGKAGVEIGPEAWAGPWAGIGQANGEPAATRPCRCLRGPPQAAAGGPPGRLPLRAGSPRR
jgi:hypothetical protein